MTNVPFKIMQSRVYKIQVNVTVSCLKVSYEYTLLRYRCLRLFLLPKGLIGSNRYTSLRYSCLCLILLPKGLIGGNWFTPLRYSCLRLILLPKGYLFDELWRLIFSTTDAHLQGELINLVFVILHNLCHKTTLLLN